jgi:uncharacterized damage-inducible protein DinB
MEVVREGTLVEGTTREMLVSFVEHHRATLALKCAGLTSEQAARRSVLPSSMSLLGLVRHMTDVEKMWFVLRFKGEEPKNLYRTEQDPDAAFNELAGVDLEESLAHWSEACDRSREITAAVDSLDELSIGTRRGNQHVSMRWMLIHLIEEYARHNGHADLLRQAIDGSVGM